MPHTVAKTFEILSERLEITPLQLSTVSKRHERVREALRREWPVVDGGDYLTGSYMRSHRKCQAPNRTKFADEGVCGGDVTTAHTFVGSYVSSVRSK